jgi:cytochrome c-type biogenesis protein CcmE
MSNPVPDTTAAPAPVASRTKWFGLGALAVAAAAFVVIAASGIGRNLVYYWTPKDLRAAGDKSVGASIRLGGLVAHQSIRRGEGASGLEFDVTDGHDTVHVWSSGVPPQLFREGIGVVVEGTMTRAGHFESSRLMVSHDNRYVAPGDEKNVDLRRLMETTQGLEEPKAGR